jgi:hypothetical protein
MEHDLLWIEKRRNAAENMYRAKPLAETADAPYWEPYPSIRYIMAAT